MSSGVPLRRWLLVALCVTGVACGKVGEPAESGVEASYGEPFDLSLGERASLDEDVRVTFDRVAEDSRCASGADCSAPGNAAVVLKVEGQAGAATLTLHTGREPRGVAAAGHWLELVELRPARSPGTAPDPRDYEVTLVVRPVP